MLCVLLAVHKYTLHSCLGRLSAGRYNKRFDKYLSLRIGHMLAPKPPILTEEGTAVLHAACTGSREGAVRYLLDYKVNPHLSFPKTNNACQSQVGDLKTTIGTPIHDLLEEAMTYKTCSNDAKRCRTLHCAVQAGHPFCIRHLAASKASVDFKRASLHPEYVEAAWTTALACAVHTARDSEGNGLACAQALLECKADPQAAASHILKECIRVAGSSSGAWIRLMVGDVTAWESTRFDSYYFWTALDYAVDCSCHEAVDVLLALGVIPHGLTASAERIVVQRKRRREPAQQAMQIADAIRLAEEEEFEKKTKSVTAKFATT